MTAHFLNGLGTGSSLRKCLLVPVAPFSDLLLPELGCPDLVPLLLMGRELPSRHSTIFPDFPGVESLSTC